MDFQLVEINNKLKNQRFQLQDVNACLAKNHLPITIQPYSILNNNHVVKIEFFSLLYNIIKLQLIKLLLKTYYINN